MSRRDARNALAALAALLLLLLLTGAPSAAQADVAQSIAAELQAAGVPGVSVTVSSPAGASASDLAAYEDSPLNPAPTVSPENLISPDPTSPLPVVTVRFGSTTFTPLPGFLAPPGQFLLPSVEDANSTAWRFEIMAALKHALADGATLAGVAMYPTAADRPDMYLTPPDPDYAPATRLVASMPVSAVEEEVRAALPAWAQDGDIEVFQVESERRVRVTLPLSPNQFALQNGQDLLRYLLTRQLQLNENGAAIGGVMLKLNDPSAGTPLFAYAGDATWGQNFSWTSPLVEAWIGQVGVGRDEELAEGLKGDLEATVEGAADSLSPPPEE